MNAAVDSPYSRLGHDLIHRIAAQLAPRDVRHYSRVNKNTHAALGPLRDLRQLQGDHQLHLMALGRVARTPQDLADIVRQILELPEWRRAEPLEVAAHQLGKAARQSGQAAATVFHAIWHATVELPEPQRLRPLLAIARQMAVLAPADRLAAMIAALAQMQPFPMDAQRHWTTHDWAHLLTGFPAGHAAVGLRHLLAEARQFSHTQRHEFVGLLKTIDCRIPLSQEERKDARTAMDALLAEAPGQQARPEADGRRPRLTPPTGA